jgi:hypothetical protein
MEKSKLTEAQLLAWARTRVRLMLGHLLLLAMRGERL